MGMAADFAEEFKKLPPGGKWAVGGVAVLVAGIGFYHYKTRGQTASGVAGTPSNQQPSGIGNLSALDTQSLAQSIAGFVNARSPSNPAPTGQGTVTPVPTPGPTGTPTRPVGSPPLYNGTGLPTRNPNGIGPAIITQGSTKVPVSSLPIGRNAPTQPVSLQSGVIQQNTTPTKNTTNYSTNQSNIGYYPGRGGHLQ